MENKPRVSPKKKVTYTVLVTIGVLFLLVIGLMVGVALLNADYTQSSVFKIIGVVGVIGTIVSVFIIVDWVSRKFGEGGLFQLGEGVCY